MGASGSAASAAAEELDWREHLEAVLDAFYGELGHRHAQERWALQQREHAGGGATTARWSQQEVHTDPCRRAVARAASRRHLERHRCWLGGPGRRSAAELLDLVALQHYVDLDLEDTRPLGALRAGDRPDDLGALVGEQLLAGWPCVARAALTIDGERFCFAELLERGAAPHDGAETAAGSGGAALAPDAEGAGGARGGAVASVPSAAEVEAQRRFVAEVSAATMRCLGQHGAPPRLLVRAVASAMSHAGLAAVERACYSSQAVPCGGSEALACALRAVRPGVWDVGLSVEQRGFDRCALARELSEALGLGGRGGGAGEGGALALECGAGESLLQREACVRYSRDGAGVRADVHRLRTELNLAPPGGAPCASLAVTEDAAYTKEVGVSCGTDPEPMRETSGVKAAWNEIGAGTYRMQKTAKKPGGRKFLYSAAFKGTLAEAGDIAEQVGGAFFVRYAKWLEVVGDDSFDAGPARDGSAVIYMRSPPPKSRVCPLETDEASRAEAHVAAVEAAESVAFAAAVEEWRRRHGSGRKASTGGRETALATGAAGFAACWSRGPG